MHSINELTIICLANLNESVYIIQSWAMVQHNIGSFDREHEKCWGWNWCTIYMVMLLFCNTFIKIYVFCFYFMLFGIVLPCDV